MHRSLPLISARHFPFAFAFAFPFPFQFHTGSSATDYCSVASRHRAYNNNNKRTHRRSGSMAQNLPHLPDWEQVSTNIIRVMGGNPSKVSLIARDSPFCFLSCLSFQARFVWSWYGFLLGACMRRRVVMARNDIVRGCDGIVVGAYQSRRKRGRSLKRP